MAKSTYYYLEGCTLYYIDPQTMDTRTETAPGQSTVEIMMKRFHRRYPSSISLREDAFERRVSAIQAEKQKLAEWNKAVGQ